MQDPIPGSDAALITATSVGVAQKAFLPVARVSPSVISIDSTHTQAGQKCERSAARQHHRQNTMSVITGTAFFLLEPESNRLLSINPDDDEKAEFCLGLVQHGAGSKKKVQMVDDSAFQLGAHPEMLLDADCTRLSWNVSFPSSAIIGPQGGMLCPHGMVLTVKRCGEVHQEKWLHKKTDSVKGTFKLVFKDVTVDSVADEETREDTEDPSKDLPAPFLQITIHRAEPGAMINSFEDTSVDEDEDDFTISEGSRKRGFLTAAVRPSKKTKASGKDTIRRNQLYGCGKPILEWKVWAATHEHVIRRATSRVEGLKALADAKVELPDELDTELKRWARAKTAEGAIELSDDDEPSELGDAEHTLKPAQPEEQAEDDVEDDEEEEHEVEVQAEKAMDVEVKVDQEELLPQASHGASVQEAPPEVAGLDELMKGCQPIYCEKASAWLLEQGVASVSMIKDAGAEEDFIKAIGLPHGIATIMVCKRLAAL